LGTGTGLLFEYLKKRKKTFVGIDISIKMLKFAKVNNESDSLHLICADLDYLPFRKNVFSTIFSITVLQNLPNPINSINEIAKVIKKDGIAFFSILKKGLTIEKFKKMFSNNLKEIFTWNMQENEDFATIRRKI